MSATNIIIKIHEFDEDSKSLIVSFTSDTSLISIEDAPKMAFQPTMFDDVDPEMIIKRLAQTGVSIAAEQDKKQALSQNTVTLNTYKSKVGQTYTFNIVQLHDELYGSVQQNVENVTIEGQVNGSA